MRLGRALCLAVLAFLLVGALGTGWWNTKAGDLMQRERTALGPVIGAVHVIRFAPTNFVPDLRGRGLTDFAAVDELVAQFDGRDAVYEALDRLDAADLTFEERALRKPLRPIADDYFTAHSRLAERNLHYTGIDGIAAGNLLLGAHDRHIAELGTVAGELAASLEARDARLCTDLEAARTIRNAAFASAVLIALLAVGLVTRWRLRPRR
ncbi:hypothetical protein [Actinoplanes sp. CA-252034]|uniref:hypothetical protein n=1 Tax=Actinoplanes sp. CA-252034 TaxID=3239906 RepID=UPI003D99C685